MAAMRRWSAGDQLTVSRREGVVWKADGTRMEVDVGAEETST
jgi:hypothetical protein